MVDGRGVLHRVPDGSFLLWIHGDRNWAIGVKAEIVIRPDKRNAVTIEFPPGSQVRVQWTRYASKYRLELQSLDEPSRRYGFGQLPGKPVWMLSTRVPFGRYRLAELRLRDLIRETELELRGSEPPPVDWSVD